MNNIRYKESKYKITEWIDKIIYEECHDWKSFCDLFAETGVVTDLVFNNFNEFYINDVLYQIKLFIKHFCKRKL
ncbi:MAG TPA: hypothetical protein DCX39_02595 [Firmicutes bacterium]|nr:hypothetical protein [Bacillota bacterium]HAX00034.1 hypothetical protein [Bacillota bacterium]HCY68183.1 hypothetical protein [Bacillota bacterium]